MDFKVWLAVLAVAVNGILMLFMYLAQQYEVHSGLTPPKGSCIQGTTRLFRHWQQFYCMTWGDGIGMSVLDVVIVHAAYYGLFAWWYFAITGPLVAIGCWGFAYACTQPGHADDYGFIGSRITLAGKLHLVYSWIQYTSGFALALAAIFGDIPEWITWTGVVGFIIWAFSMFVDMMLGHFEPIEPLKPK